MTCCSSTIINFLSVASTSIIYSPAMQTAYGPEPNVQVYFKVGTEYQLSDDMNEVKFDGTTIEIDHGGVNSGFIKIF